MSMHPTHVARRRVLLALALVALAILVSGGHMVDPRLGL